MGSGTKDDDQTSYKFVNPDGAKKRTEPPKRAAQPYWPSRRGSKKPPFGKATIVGQAPLDFDPPPDEEPITQRIPSTPPIPPVVPPNTARAATPQTAAPQTAAPQTAAPETAAPETAAPQTAAPQTAAPQTAAQRAAARQAAAQQAAVQRAAAHEKAQLAVEQQKAKQAAAQQKARAAAQRLAPPAGKPADLKKTIVGQPPPALADPRRAQRAAHPPASPDDAPLPAPAQPTTSGQRAAPSLDEPQSFVELSALPKAAPLARATIAPPGRSAVRVDPIRYRIAIFGGAAISTGLAVGSWFVPTLVFAIPVGLLMSAIGALTLLHRMWAAIEDDHSRTTPNRAVGLMLVPLFNMYWAFNVVAGFATDFNDYIARNRIAAPRLSRDLLLAAMCIPIANVVIGWIALGRVCEAVNAVSRPQSAAPAQGT